ncbi:MAG: Recombination protein RecR [Anaerolineales bacterium]|nr:Recombination protein RecR [Anaerolineales bacterium]
MTTVAKPVSRLIDEFSRLPGIGPKTASRLTFFLLRVPDEQTLALAEALRDLTEQVVYCERCYNISDRSPCSICASPERDHSTLCVVEEPLDVMALERTHEYKGVYHVLHGAISPVEGIGPTDLRIDELMDRLRHDTVNEVILATNPNLEGEATAMYLERLIKPLEVRATRPAYGLPVGGDLEYADEVTLARALEGRREL